jgi:hypothetical protein
MRHKFLVYQFKAGKFEANNGYLSWLLILQYIWNSACKTPHRIGTGWRTIAVQVWKVGQRGLRVSGQWRSACGDQKRDKKAKGSVMLPCRHDLSRRVASIVA